MDFVPMSILDGDVQYLSLHQERKDILARTIQPQIRPISLGNCRLQRRHQKVGVFRRS
jgi:hypothetical protein